MNWSKYAVDCRPLRIPAFRRLWWAWTVSAVGGSFALIAVPTQLFTQTGSSAAVGLSATMSLGALVTAALWAGTPADAMDRRRLLLAGHAGLGLAYLGLWLNAALGLDSVPVLLGLVAVQGVSFGVTSTATGAVVPDVVPRDQLVAANSLASLTRYAGAVVGPLIAGTLIPLIGLETLYLLDAFALGVVLWAVRGLPPLPRPGQQPTTAGRATLHRLGAGLRYLAGQRLLVAVLAVDLAAMVFALPVALFPELADRAFGGPTGGGMVLGLLFAAYPAGVLLVGLLSGTFSRARRHGALMASAAIAWGGCVVLLGLAAKVWVAVAALVAGGAVNFVLSTCRNAITQAHAHDALRGRIQGTLIVVTMGGPQLANVLHGWGGAVWGARAAVTVGGALTVLAVALLLWAVPELWHYDADRDSSTTRGQPADRGSGDGRPARRPAPPPR